MKRWMVASATFTLLAAACPAGGGEDAPSAGWSRGPIPVITIPISVITMPISVITIDRSG